MNIRTLLLLLTLVLPMNSCTIYHSRQADFATVNGTLDPNATFVSEEDSGLQLLGLFTITEADHFALLMKRAQDRHRCSQMRFAQLDYYTDNWGIVAFPIARVTLICEHETPAPVETTPAAAKRRANTRKPSPTAATE